MAVRRETAWVSGGSKVPRCGKKCRVGRRGRLAPAPMRCDPGLPIIRCTAESEGARHTPTAMRNSLDVEGPPAATRVVVAMSGGVDSSVTAALLKAEGYDVVGVTLQLYDHGAATHRKGACCAGQDIHDARAVAERIGIPHYVLDYESRFKEAVI